MLSRTTSSKFYRSDARNWRSLCLCCGFFVTTLAVFTPFLIDWIVGGARKKVQPLALTSHFVSITKIENWKLLRRAMLIMLIHSWLSSTHQKWTLHYFIYERSSAAHLQIDVVDVALFTSTYHIARDLVFDTAPMLNATTTPTTFPVSLTMWFLQFNNFKCL